MGLKKLGKMKGISTIFMENVPQLIIQIIYSFNIGEVSNNTQLAFVGSMISVISALLSYFIEQSNTDNMIVFKYYLKMTKNDIVNNVVMDPKANNNDEDEMKIEAVTPNTPKSNDHAINYSNIKSQTVSSKLSKINNNEHAVEFSNSGTLPNFLTSNEREHFINHRGETAALSSKLCSIFCIPEKNIEVSKASNITSAGIMLYLIHFINRDDNGLDMYDVDINEIKKLYKKNAKKINDSFKKQFDFKTNDFKVGWKRYADDNDEDENETLKTDIFDAVKSAVTFMELDFQSIDIRKKFLTDYLLMEGVVENENENFIAEIEEEQKAEERGMNDDEIVNVINDDAEDGIIATINQTNFNQPQMSSVKEELRKKREDLKSNGNGMEPMKMDNLKMGTNDTTMV